MRMKNFLLLIALTVSSLQSMAQKTDKPKDKPQSEQTSSRYNAPGDIPLEDFFLNPTKTDFKISPDGSVLAYLSPQNKRMNIFFSIKKIYPSKGLALKRPDRDL